VWNQTPESKKFSERFYRRTHYFPDIGQAGTYSAVLNYLKAVELAGTTDAATVMKTLRSMTINDAVISNGHLRVDGSMVHDSFLVKVNTMTEMENPYDFFKIEEKFSGDSIAFPLERSTCANVQNKNSVNNVKTATATEVKPAASAGVKPAAAAEVKPAASAGVKPASSVVADKVK
jgi:branched-chain amino acid transport system substrate-binding protein